MSSPLTVSKRTLTFPLTPSPSDTITLQNTGSLPAAFKVKTTNPQRYVVRPNLGALAPHASVDVTVALHRAAGGDADLAPGPARDKFLLQAAPAPGLEAGESAVAFWGEGVPEGTTSVKLRVVFVEAKAAAVAGVGAGGEGSARSAGSAGRPGRAGVVEDELLLMSEGNGDKARRRVETLQGEVDGKAAEVARIKAALKETQAEKETVLREAPKAPLSANQVVTDPFGGVSVAAIALLMVLFAIVAKTVFSGRDVAV